MNKNLQISKFCSPFLLTVEKEASINDVIYIMKESDIRHIPVVENGIPLGIISERDLKVFEDRDFAEKFCAGDIMTEKPFTVDEDTDLREVLDKMNDEKFGSCLVRSKETQKITGIFTMVDALRTLQIILKRTDENNKYVTV